MLYTAIGLYLIQSVCGSHKCCDLTVRHDKECKAIKQKIGKLVAKDVGKITLRDMINVSKCKCKNKIFTCAMCPEMNFGEAKRSKIKAATQQFNKHVVPIRKTVHEKMIKLMELINEPTAGTTFNPYYPITDLMLEKLFRYVVRTVGELSLAPDTVTFLNSLEKSIATAQTTKKLITILDQAMQEISKIEEMKNAQFKEMEKQLRGCVSYLYGPAGAADKTVNELFHALPAVLMSVYNRAQRNKKVELSVEVYGFMNKLEQGKDFNSWTCDELREMAVDIIKFTERVHAPKRRRMNALECVSNKWF